MWTMVIFTMLVALPPGSGASSTTTTIPNMKFDSRSDCIAELASMLQTLPVFDQGNRQVGVFRVWGHCVAAPPRT